MDYNNYQEPLFDLNLFGSGDSRDRYTRVSFESDEDIGDPGDQVIVHIHKRTGLLGGENYQIENAAKLEDYTLPGKVIIFNGVLMIALGGILMVREVRFDIDEWKREKTIGSAG